MLARDFTAWAGRRLIGAGGLTVLGALVDGLSIVLLVPVIGFLLDPGVGSAPGAGVLAALVGLLPGPPEMRFSLVLALFAGVLLIRAGVVHRRDMALARLEHAYVAHLRLTFFRRMAFAPWSEAARLGRGEVGHALARDLDRAGVAVGALLRGAGAIFVLAVQLGIALWLAPEVTAIVAGLGALAFAALAPLRRRAHRLGVDVTREDYELFSGTAGFLRGLKAAKAHGLETRYLDGLARAARGYGAQLVAMRRDTSLGTLALQTAAGLLALVAVYAGHMWFAVAPEALVVVILVMARIGAPLQGIQMAIQGLRFGDAAFGAAHARIAERLPPAPKAAPPGAPGPPPWPAAPDLRLEAVAHVGEGGRTILSDISAEIPAGRVTAIVGPSGAGKTTLCDLLVGLEAPSAGRILIDGHPLDAATRARMAPVTAYVGQDDALIEETLRANLTLGAAPGTIDDAAIWAALAATGAERPVRASECGLDGAFRNEAARFSGGERQRLRLARALLRRPRLLILDEATSALDFDAEIAVLGAVFAAAGDATAILVTHRPGAAELADHRLRLVDGRLADQRLADRNPPDQSPTDGT